MTQPTDEEKMKNVEMLWKLLGKISGDRGEKVKAMMEGRVGEIYATCPASSRAEYHSAYPGGLLAHSLNVVQNLNKIAGALCPDKFSKETIIFVGLFHDLGKVGDGVQEYYVPHHSDWHRKQGMLYEINKECISMPTSERGLYILQKFGIEVSSDEYLAIRLNDGQYDQTNKSYAMKEPELALLVHWADMWSCQQEKE